MLYFDKIYKWNYFRHWCTMIKKQTTNIHNGNMDCCCWYMWPTSRLYLNNFKVNITANHTTTTFFFFFKASASASVFCQYVNTVWQFQMSNALWHTHTHTEKRAWHLIHFITDWQLVALTHHETSTYFTVTVIIFSTRKKHLYFTGTNIRSC